jgi:four helix bundle protein
MINSKRYDLEERTLQFAKDVIIFTNSLPKTTANIEMVKQVIRSSGSVGANYIEANESLGKKDFAMRIRICRKEAKETVYWLKLVETNDNSLDIKRALYIQEGTEIMKIFGAILIKSE